MAIDQNAHSYLRSVTLVILSVFSTGRILASPTTEPGRRGWSRRLGSPISTPHFFHPDSLSSPLLPHFPPASNRIEDNTTNFPGEAKCESSSFCSCLFVS